MTGPETPSDHGWPTLASVHALVVGIDRQLATALAEMARTREELIEHKADSHRVHEQQDREIRTLSHWRWWLTGGLAALGFLVAFLGRPLVALATGQ